MTPPRTPARRTARSGRVAPRPGRRLLKWDQALGVRWVAGADEAGRGALAGPLVAASVVLDVPRLVGPDASPLNRLDDSKKLTEEVREALYAAVLAVAASVRVVAISPGAIDRNGLHVSNIAAMRRAISSHACPVDIGIVDGFEVGADTAFECRRVVRGDGTSAAVAASAIVAKVTRDRLMRRLCIETDGRWAFSDHVGYATPLHAERIQMHGLTHLHRRSYEAQAYVGAPCSPLAHPGTVTFHHVRAARNAALAAIAVG